MNFRVSQFMIKLYYLITPVFILLDYVFHFNIRVAVLDLQPFYKAFYYGFCVLCGTAILVRPKFTPVVALFESSILLFIVIIDFFSRVYGVFLQEDILSFDSINLNSINLDSVNMAYSINLIITMGIAYLSLRKSQQILGIS